MTKLGPIRVALFLFVGSLLMQAAWVLALPPFRGLDEFDHVYRAEAVAHGQWRTKSGQAPFGEPGGELVKVPASVVAAAGPECLTYSYTQHDDCWPAKVLSHGMVEVSSTAARYNPAFYEVVGAPALPFGGASALYAMRGVAAVLCSAFLALAGAATALWARSRWPLIALAVAMTPVAVYSTVVVAPNGIEMCAALSLWAALLGLSRGKLSMRAERTLVWVCLPGAVVLATVRSLGPLWLALIVCTMVLLAGWSRVVKVWRRQRLPLIVVSTCSLAATAASAWWILSERALGLGAAPVVFADPVVNTLRQVPVWYFQGIAAFPARDQPAPTAVYVLDAVVLIALIASALRIGHRRDRRNLILALAVSIVVPVCAQAMVYSTQGSIWQGRYGLPYTFGVMLIAGYALDHRSPQLRAVRPALVMGWLFLTAAQAVSVAGVLGQERLHSPLAGTSEWLMPSLWQVVLLTVTGWLLWGALWSARGRSDESPAGRNQIDRMCRDSISSRSLAKVRDV